MNALFGAMPLLLGLLATSETLADNRPTPAGTWYNPGGESPPICMRFVSDGKLLFSGGFVFFNPSKWEFTEAKEELTIYLGGTAAFPAKSAESQFNLRRSIERFDEKSRSLVYSFNSSVERLEFLGFFFYRRPCDGAS
jgi:hypothetical protein